MTVAEVLERAGIAKGSPDYGLEFNLCYAAMFGGLGIRQGSSEAVRRVLREEGLAEIDGQKAVEFGVLLSRIANRGIL